MFKNIIDNFKKKKILVIGDLIVDHYIFCDAIGKSAESPTLVVKENEERVYVGGAGIVARHLRALGAKAMFVSCLGNDCVANHVLQVLKKEGVDYAIFKDASRPTTVKRRYIADEYKLLRTSVIAEHFIPQRIENNIIKTIELARPDAIIVSDFNYGLITDNILAAIETKTCLKFGDCQSSSQIGDFKQFRNYDVITPTVKEAQIALAEQHDSPEILAEKLMNVTGSNSIVITRGSSGLFWKNGIRSGTVPALNVHQKDTMGAGDSFLAAMALSMTSGALISEACFIGSCMAAEKINLFGNIPIGIDQLKAAIKKYRGLYDQKK